MLLRLALRNASRNVRRTLLTAGIIMFGTALLATAIAWFDGVFGQMLDLITASSGHVRVVQPEFARLEQLMPLDENLSDVQLAADAIAKMPGVLGAYPRIMTGATLTLGEEIGDHFAPLIGAPEGYYTGQMDLDGYLVDGTWLSGGEKEVVLGWQIAEDVGATVGDEMVLYGMTQDGAMSGRVARVMGIVHASNPLIDSQAYMTLAEVQYLTDLEGAATELMVYGASRDVATELAASIADLPELDGLLIEAWNTRDPWAGMLAVIDVVQGVLLAIMVFITALGVLNTMTMSVMERTGEVGVLRAMGMGRMGAVLLFVIEALVIALIGGAMGVVLGGAMGTYLEVYGVTLGEDVVSRLDASTPMAAVLYADVTAEGLLTAFALGLVMALVGSALPALRAASIQPIEAMRTRR